MQDAFLATLSHELRTPMTSILGWVRMMRTGGIPQTQFSQALETIERQAKAQVQLIDDLLDVNRIITGKLRINVHPVELVPIIDAVLDGLNPAAAAKSITIERLFDHQHWVVQGDPDRLQQVFWNLLCNAIKFTPTGGVVQMQISQVSHRAEFTISDNGEGVAAEFLPYIFERFKQEDCSITRRHAGLGLGLAITRHLIELHGGTISVESEGVGKGSLFRIGLPLASAVFPRQPVVTSDAALIDTDWPSLSGCRVLIVDDDPMTLELLSAVIERAEGLPAIASSANEALLILEGQTFDLLLSDIGMAGGDGYWFMRTVRDRGLATPAIALTAYTREEDRRACLLAGYQGHLSKPIDPRELCECIRAYCCAAAAAA